MKNILPLALFLLFCGTTFAQTKKAPEAPDFWQEFQKMQQQLMQSLRDMPQGGAFQWDTTFTFGFDSLFNGGGYSGHFFMNPFGQDTTGMDNPFGDSPLQGFQWSFPPGFMTPENDENSAIQDQGDGLLPEERLRREDDEKSGKAPSDDKSVAPEPAKKPKVKTIRI